jgi:hypothetical protein
VKRENNPSRFSGDTVSYQSLHHDHLIRLPGRGHPLRVTYLTKENVMQFVKPSSKKQASMPGPNSPAYKKLLAAQKSGNSTQARKSRRPSTAFSSLKSRQRIVERVKRAIWAKVLEINDAIINLALCGNYSAAKALFDFAGVYALPTPDDEAAPAAQSQPTLLAPAAESPAAPNPIDAFFRSIGVEPPIDEPAPGLAPQTL